MQVVSPRKISHHVQTSGSHSKPERRVLHIMPAQAIPPSRQSKVQKVKIFFLALSLPFQYSKTLYICNMFNVNFPVSLYFWWDRGIRPRSKQCCQVIGKVNKKMWWSRSSQLHLRCIVFNKLFKRNMIFIYNNYNNNNKISLTNTHTHTYTHIHTHLEWILYVLFVS